MIGLKSNNGLTKTVTALKRKSGLGPYKNLHRFGQEGVQALAVATPKDTGETAAGWAYRIENTGRQIKIVWYNENVVDGVNIAVIRQLGHGTGTGGWVEGIDYINPVMKPVFEKIAADVWKEVIR